MSNSPEVKLVNDVEWFGMDWPKLHSGQHCTIVKWDNQQAPELCIVALPDGRQLWVKKTDVEGYMP